MAEQELAMAQGTDMAAAGATDLAATGQAKPSTGLNRGSCVRVIRT